MTAGDLAHDGHDTYLRIAATPILLPPKAAAAVRAQRDATPGRANYQQPADGTQPLFPGRLHGHPITAEALSRKLRQHGIAPRQWRNAALAAWATQLPAPVLADVLGLSISTTAPAWLSLCRDDAVGARVGVGVVSGTGCSVWQPGTSGGPAHGLPRPDPQVTVSWRPAGLAAP